MKVKYNAMYPNNPNPRSTFKGKPVFCGKCAAKFSYWDKLNISPDDKEVLCARCKGIEIEYIVNPDQIK